MQRQRRWSRCDLCSPTSSPKSNASSTSCGATTNQSNHPMPSEAQARITINKLLEEAGWRFLPDAQGRRENIICEHRVTRRTFSPSQDLGKDFEHTPQGFVDYVLLNNDQRPVALTEAKREGIDPL